MVAEVVVIYLDGNAKKGIAISFFKYNNKTKKRNKKRNRKGKGKRNCVRFVKKKNSNTDVRIVI